MIPLVTSTRENCLGSECPRVPRTATSMKARREAMAADLVVVNHHLFFADLALRDSGVAELLPSVERGGLRRGAPARRGRRAVPRHARSAAAQVIDFARDMLGAGLQQARGLVPWQELAAACDRAARDLRLAARGPLARGARQR